MTHAALLRVLFIALSLSLSQAVEAAKQRIDVWTMSLSPKFDGYFKSLVSTYNAQHPNVEVVWTDYPWDAIQTKFTAAVASGHPPALINLNVPWTWDYQRAGLLQPVDALMDKTQYLPGAQADISIDGKVYGFPYYNAANITVFNGELFRKAGLDIQKPPRNLDEVLSYANQIKARTGVAGIAPALGPTKIEGFFLEQGLPIVKDGKAVFNSPAHVILVRKLAAAWQTGALSRDNLFPRDNFQKQLDAYARGQIAMLVTSPTSLARIRDDAPTVYKVTEVAAAPAGPTGVIPGGWMLSFAIARNVDAALLPEAGRFASWLTNAENQLLFAKQSGTLPTARKAVEDASFSAIPANADPMRKAIAVAARNLDKVRTQFMGGIKDSESLSARLSGAVEQAVTGRKEPQAALDEAAAFWNRKLATGR
ncbi:extracellular solute-binding protein [Burkholderiaceae bacterium DAT-1]|nr:extracellular solute-binding protein [Burkholderiaceae bacterium DAT-1]